MKKNTIALMIFTVIWNINCITLMVLMLTLPNVTQPDATYFVLVIAAFWLAVNWLFITGIKMNLNS